MKAKRLIKRLIKYFYRIFHSNDYIMKFTFRLVRPKTDKYTSLYLDIRHKGKRSAWGTGQTTHPELWNHSEQRVNPNKYYKKKHLKTTPGLLTQIENTNNALEDILRACSNYVRESQVKGHELNGEGLKRYLDGIFKEESPVTENEEKIPFVVDYYQHHYLPKIISGEITYQKNSSRMRYSKGSIKAKKANLNAFISYEKENPRIRFDEVDLSFYDQFISYHESKDISANYIGRLIKELKVILRHAYEKGIHSNRIFEDKKFATLREEVKSVYLTESELKKLQSLELEGKEKQYRDMFLVGCYTAMRFSDYSRLTPKDIISSERGHFIDLITQKTGERVIVPIRPELRDILNDPEYFNAGIVYEQKLNKAVKRLCKVAGIVDPIQVKKMRSGRPIVAQTPKNELITTHTARRTGATLMYLAGIPTIDIMKITGHKTEKNLLKYIRVTKEETANRLIDHPFFNPLRKVK